MICACDYRPPRNQKILIGFDSPEIAGTVVGFVASAVFSTLAEGAEPSGTTKLAFLTPAD
jgi:hypothetical protein